MHYAKGITESAGQIAAWDVVEFAGIAHDLGHPPFGHNGEYVLDELMIDDGGFEGNAQTLRILSCLEKKSTEEYPPTRGFANGKDIRRGLDITCRGLASVLKYDRQIPILRPVAERDRPVKGFYKSESDLVSTIKANVTGVAPARFKTIECSIMDVADDIAYSTYDIEDAFAAGFLNPIAILSYDDQMKQGMVVRIQEKIDFEFSELSEPDRLIDLDVMNGALENVFASVIKIDGMVFKETWTGEKLGAAVGGDVFRRSERIARSAYQRTQFASDLIARFISQVEVVKIGSNPVFWLVRPSLRSFIAIEALKTISYTQLIASGRFLADRKRAHHIISRVFTALEESGSDLMTEDWRKVFDNYKDDPQQRKRTVCDFIAGMTNRYCLEFYQRLFGLQPPSIHKP